MSWLYEILTGRMRDPDGNLVGVGYSGAPTHKNNPVFTGLHNLGPIPQGKYRIGKPVDTVTHGPYVLPLSPDSDNEMFGRRDFLIHGDSIVAPGTASEGCIIMSKDVRHLMGNSSDHFLAVVSGTFTSNTGLTA